MLAEHYLCCFPRQYKVHQKTFRGYKFHLPVPAFTSYCGFTLFFRFVYVLPVSCFAINTSIFIPHLSKTLNAGFIFRLRIPAFTFSWKKRKRNSNLPTCVYDLSINGLHLRTLFFFSLSLLFIQKDLVSCKDKIRG